MKVSRVYRENGLIENLQTLLLALSAISFLACVRLKQFTNRWLMYAFAFICYSLLVREIEIIRFDIPASIKMAMTGRGRTVIFIVVFAMLAYYGARNFWPNVAAGLHFAKSVRGYLVFAAAASMVAAHILEEVTHWRYVTYLEEIIELGGYGMLLLASLPSTVSRKATVTPEPAPSEHVGRLEQQVLA